MSKICDNCKYENDDNAVYCSSCGKSLEKSIMDTSIETCERVNNIYKKILIAIIIFFAFLIIICIIAKSLVGVIIVLIIGVPIIIRFTFDYLTDKLTTSSMKISKDRYESYINKKK